MKYRQRRNIRRDSLVLGAVALSLGGGALAEPAAQLPEVAVTATRTERRLDEVPASVTVIGAPEIASQQPIRSEEVLRNCEGIDLKSDAGGTVAMISLRGLGGSFAGQTTQLLVDGMPIEPVVLAPKGAAFDFADLGEIERIEIVRGPGAALYGPSAMGGVVNVLTRRPAPGLAGEAEVGAGSHETRSSRVALAGGSETIDFRVFASEFDSAGYRSERRAFAWNERDLKGRDWRQDKYGISVGVHPNENQELNFGVRHFHTDAAFVGGRPNYRWDRDGTSYHLGFRQDLGDLGNFQIRYLTTTIREHLAWDGLVINQDPADFTRYQTGQRNEYGEMLEAQLTLKVARAHSVTLGISDAYGSQVEGDDLAVPASSPAGWDYFALSEVRSKTRVLGLFAQDEIALSDTTRLIVGGRYDRFRQFGNASSAWDNYGTDSLREDPDSSNGVFNPRLGVRHKLAENTSLYAAYGTAYLPALNSLRYRADSSCNSPDLDPERSTTYETGFSHQGAAFAVRGAIFHTDYQDKIEARQGASCTQYVNVGGVSIDGLELGVEGRLATAWRPYANYTFNDAKIVDNPANLASEGKRLNWTPRHKFNVGVLYAPSRELSARLAGRYVGERYFDNTMTNSPDARAPGYFVADFKISRRLDLGPALPASELSFAINNLFDRSYVEQKGYAALWGGPAETFRQYADGRSYWLGLKTTF